MINPCKIFDQAKCVKFHMPTLEWGTPPHCMHYIDFQLIFHLTSHEEKSPPVQAVC